jgi:glutamate/tyrosine decarboxylase-like PLP-dependent enzyme
MEYWKKLSQDDIQGTIFNALNENINYLESPFLGIPASHLDEKVFNQDASFLKDAPFMTTMIKNPNHIGCHTMGHSESFFSGTHQLERDVIDICACDILEGERDKVDGYVASGGTEANLQAVWVYRNYFQEKEKVDTNQIVILCSEDTHYSADKAGNVFGLKVLKVPVHKTTRAIQKQALKGVVSKAKNDGTTCFIVLSNMMTTMFGSIDDVNLYADVLKEAQVSFKIHIDGAFGGFYYPFTDKKKELTFKNPNISSFTLDAHKMAQAPYGTGIFLIRKGYLEYANTKEASYVEGEDCTLIGSRSGANAVAIWMILSKHGPHGWSEKIFILQKRTAWMCDRLDEKGLQYFRDSLSNIITIDASCIKTTVAKEFGLVPDSHANPSWYKIVVMEHVTIEKLEALNEKL